MTEAETRDPSVSEESKEFEEDTDVQERSPQEEAEATEPARKFNVVDRRHWAQEDDDEGGEEETASKPTYVAELEAKVAELEGLVEGVRQQAREAKSDFESARARLRREMSKELEQYKRGFLGELIAVLDNLDLATHSVREGGDIDALMSGVEMVRKQFWDTLEGLGVRHMDSMGQEFNPNHQEAVSMVPVADADQDGKVVGVIKETYLLGEETLRAGQVAVGKASNS